MYFGNSDAHSLLIEHSPGRSLNHITNVVCRVIVSSVFSLSLYSAYDSVVALCPQLKLICVRLDYALGTKHTCAGFEQVIDRKRGRGERASATRQTCNQTRFANMSYEYSRHNVDSITLRGAPCHFDRVSLIYKYYV